MLHIYIYTHTQYILTFTQKNNIYICVYVSYWIHLGFPICTCIHSWPHEIGQPMWELIPTKKLILPLSAAITTCGSYVGMALCGISPVCIGMSAVLSLCLSSLSIKLLCLHGYIFPFNFWRCYLEIGMLGLWLLWLSAPIFHSDSWVSDVGAALQMDQLELWTL